MVERVLFVVYRVFFVAAAMGGAMFYVFALVFFIDAGLLDVAFLWALPVLHQVVRALR